VKWALAGDTLSLKIGQRQRLKATVNGDSMNDKTASGHNTPYDVTGTRVK
jgi:hypothetical protein